MSVHLTVVTAIQCFGDPCKGQGASWMKPDRVGRAPMHTAAACTPFPVVAHRQDRARITRHEATEITRCIRTMVHRRWRHW